VIWDVQHGSAAYLRTPTGKHIVIDVGVGSMMKPASATFSPLWQLRNEYDIPSLDALILTHPHRDHLDDIGNLNLLYPKALVMPRHIPEKVIRAGNKPGDQPIIDEYLKLLRAGVGQQMPPHLNPHSRDVTGLDGLHVFVPDTYTGTNLNNHSLVVVIKYAGSTILLPGDNEAASWAELLMQPRFVEAIKGTNVLIAPHHGREAGYSSDLMAKISPKLVIISDTDHGSTSVTDKYYTHAAGWNIWSRSKKEYETRYCVTTRSDDSIVLDMYRADDGKNRLNVTID